MKTRMEMWREYREEIEQNISLQDAAKHSDSRFNILQKRLNKVFPDYDKKFSSRLSSFKAKISKAENVQLINIEEIEKFLEKLEVYDFDEGRSLLAIDKLTFATEELSEVIKEMKESKNRGERHFFDPVEAVDDLKITTIHRIHLGGKMQKFRIAIDGPSGSGKSTVAKQFAKKHQLNYINTGLIYRAIALNALNNSINIDSSEDVIDSLVKDMIELLPNEVVHLHKKDVTKLLRSDIVSQVASKIAIIPEVRNYALMISKHYASIPGTIMDGRDTTFNVMPDADLKIFLDTSPEIRAARRVEQNKTLGYNDNYEQILAEIKERDHRDRTRVVDPLHKTEDTFLIDASNMSIDEVVAMMENLLTKIKV